ncbi:MAG: Spy/CpxP family protein refolding chaperone [Acidobacteria bacterium]|nr:Spy/CpxP family protein refolding chaperone [Acidobacteriota bacterium]
MRSSAPRVLLAAALVAALAGPAAAQSYAWWKSEAMKKEIGLSDEQSAKIDAVVQSTMPTLRQGKGDLDREEAELSRLIEINAGEPDVIRQIDKVESIRAFLNKTRTLMLLRERQVLTPEQRTALRASYEKSRRDRRPGGGRRGNDTPGREDRN